jgi:HSP20 family protein
VNRGARAKAPQKEERDMAEKKAKEEGTRSVAPWRPFGDFEPWPSLFGEGLLSRRFPRLLDDLFREWPAAARGQALVPAMDVTENDQRYTVTVEIPGSGKDDVHVELQEGMLTIHGEKKSEREEKKEHRRYVERTYGAFSRSFRLPPDADADHLDAAFKDGVLTITIPKTEEAKPRSIAIKSS